MDPLSGVCQTIAFRMHIEGPGCSYDEEKTWILIVSCSCSYVGNLRSTAIAHFSCIICHQIRGWMANMKQNGGLCHNRMHGLQVKCLIFDFRVWAIYSMDVHHILIILESKCAMCIVYYAWCATNSRYSCIEIVKLNGHYTKFSMISGTVCISISTIVWWCMMGNGLYMHLEYITIRRGQSLYNAPAASWPRTAASAMYLPVQATSSIGGSHIGIFQLHWNGSMAMAAIMQFAMYNRISTSKWEWKIRIGI